MWFPKCIPRWEFVLFSQWYGGHQTLILSFPIIVKSHASCYVVTICFPKSYLITCSLSHWVYSSTPSLYSTGFINWSWLLLIPPMNLPCCIPGHGQNLSRNWSSASPHIIEDECAILWLSCDKCATTCLAGHLIGRPGTLEFQPSFHSICFILWIDASFDAP